VPCLRRRFRPIPRMAFIVRRFVLELDRGAHGLEFASRKGCVMVLTVRQGYRIFEIEAPLGSRIERDQTKEWLVIQGNDPAETWVVVPRSRLLDAARAGLYGLSLRARQIPLSLS
jgi:hypothetical protein